LAENKPRDILGKHYGMQPKRSRTFLHRKKCAANKTQITMEQGTIKRLTDRGFGFIAREGEEKDLFFHSNELQGVKFSELREGDKVQFEVTESPKGPNATKVSRV